MKCCRHAGLHLKKQKCQFLARLVEYLGFIIDQQSIHPSEWKVKAINLTELKAYLELLTYYGKFLWNIANIHGPFYHLLKKILSGTGRSTTEGICSV